MAKLKPYLALIAKHHFWILCVIVTMTGVISWFSASGSLASQTAARKGEIDGAFSKVNGLTGNLPNEKFAERVNGEHERLKSRVLKAWRELYEGQQQLLVWPEQVAAIAKVPEGQEIPLPLRQAYQSVAAFELQRLIINKLNARREKQLSPEEILALGGGAEASVAGMMTGGGMRGPEYEGIVAWSTGNLSSLYERYNFPTVPTTVQIRLTQEDIWVIESMLEAIGVANAGATDPLNAAIKKIDMIDVAQWAMAAAAQDKGMITETIIAAPAGEGMGEGASPYGQMVPTAEGIGAIPDVDGQLTTNRYVDVTGEALSSDAQPFAEFRQLFVAMQLTVDQRRIPEILAAFANARIRLEVRQVRMNPLDTTGVNPAGGGGGMGYPGGGRAGAMGAMGAMGPGMGYGGYGARGGGEGVGYSGGYSGGMGGGTGLAGLVPGLQPDLAEGDKSPFDAPLDIRGVVYLYNKPEAEKLGSGAAAAEGGRPFATPTKPVQAPGGAGGGYGAGYGGGYPSGAGGGSADR